MQELKVLEVVRNNLESSKWSRMNAAVGVIHSTLKYERLWRARGYDFPALVTMRFEPMQELLFGYSPFRGAFKNFDEFYEHICASGTATPSMIEVLGFVMGVATFLKSQESGRMTVAKRECLYKCCDIILNWREVEVMPGLLVIRSLFPDMC